MGKRIATIKFANASQAKKAIDELDRSTIEGQSRYIEVQADEYRKAKKGGNSGNCASGKCKWCAIGECWTSGQIEKPADAKATGGGNKVKKGNLKQSNGPKGSGGKGGGKMAMMQAMMKMMMGGNKW